MRAAVASGESLEGRIFRRHTANALYLAQKEMRVALNSPMPENAEKLSQAEAVEQIIGSDYFERFCINQQDTRGILRIFEGDRGKEQAMKQFGKAISQKSRPLHPEPELEVTSPEKTGKAALKVR